MTTEQTEISRLFYLIACSLRDEKPEEAFLEGTDPSRLLALAEGQSLSAITCMALQKTDYLNRIDPALAKRWRERKEKSIRKNIMLDAARESILEEMERRGIW